jgi:NDP-sugar pyrophosphorylase family protein
MKAIILAGGLGTRLPPVTFAIPKPLLPVGDKPILQIIISQIRNAGIDEITLAAGYQAEPIKAFRGDGSQFGETISHVYVHEQKPLGTAGPLALCREQCRIGIETVEHLDEVMKEIGRLPAETFAGKAS